MQFIGRTIRFTYILTEYQITRFISLKIKELKHTKSKPGFHILWIFVICKVRLTKLVI